LNSFILLPQTRKASPVFNHQLLYAYFTCSAISRTPSCDWVAWRDGASGGLTGAARKSNVLGALLVH
jgi:hypothetical protein